MFFFVCFVLVELFEALLSCHLYYIIIRAVPSVYCTRVSVWLRQSGPQQAGGGVVKVGEESGHSGVGVGHRESPRPCKQRVGEHSRRREQWLAVAERKT